MNARESAARRTFGKRERRTVMDFGIFYEIQVASPLKHREREYQVFH